MVITVAGDKKEDIYSQLTSDSYALKEGDSVEFLYFMGGGR